jgi:hypothetical protein
LRELGRTGKFGNPKDVRESKRPAKCLSNVSLVAAYWSPDSFFLHHKTVWAPQPAFYLSAGTIYSAGNSFYRLAIQEVDATGSPGQPLVESLRYE